MWRDVSRTAHGCRPAHRHRVHLGWMVAVYDLGEAVANLVQPFWMMPVLGLLVLGLPVLGATLGYPL